MRCEDYRYGAMKKCPVCGEEFFIRHVGSWLPKYETKNKRLYFCKNSHKEQWLAEHRPAKKVDDRYDE